MPKFTSKKQVIFELTKYIVLFLHYFCAMMKSHNSVALVLLLLVMYQTIFAQDRVLHPTREVVCYYDSILYFSTDSTLKKAVSDSLEWAFYEQQRAGLDIHNILPDSTLAITKMGALADGILLLSWDVKQSGVERSRCIGFHNLCAVFVFHNSAIISSKVHIVGEERWSEACYYAFTTTSDGRNNYFTLLGKSQGDYSNFKTIEVLYFKNGQAFLGKQLFSNLPDVYRIVFEYAKTVKMLLGVEKSPSISVDKRWRSNDRIVFDFLTPKRPEMEGFFQEYVPSLSYDAYQWKQFYWEYKEEVKVNFKEVVPPLPLTIKRVVLHDTI